jgi:general secretion pathway protein H
MMISAPNVADPKAGFTLIEVLACLAILALVMAVAIPSMMRPSDTLVLARTVRQVQAALRVTRSAAIASGSEQVFLIDVKQRTYTSPAIKLQRFPDALEAKLTLAEPEREASHKGGIRFFPDGSSTGGELHFSLGANTANLCIHWLTGRPVEGEDCR